MEVFSKLEPVTYYKADDGRVFKTRSDCQDYEMRKNGNRITCDECNGLGGIKYFGFENGGHDSEPAPYVKGYTSPCGKCSGRGFLDKTTVFK